MGRWGQCECGVRVIQIVSVTARKYIQIHNKFTNSNDILTNTGNRDNNWCKNKEHLTFVLPARFLFFLLQNHAFNYCMVFLQENQKTRRYLRI